MSNPAVVQGDGITLIIGDCSHDREQITHGPTTDQINHWCPDCLRRWTTWPNRSSPSENAAMPQTPAERQEARRKRLLIGEGKTEVRGIFAPPDLHAAIKEAAKKLAGQLARKKPPIEAE